MDINTIDQNHNQLQQQSQQTVQLITALAQKMQTAAAEGDEKAREWLLDLKEITLGFRAEQNQVSLLLQAMHTFVANQPQQSAQPQYQQPQYQQPVYQQPVYREPYQQQSGFGRFMGSSFGQAMAAGAGFAIGEEIIDDIF